jgi:hypothetical protein
MSFMTFKPMLFAAVSLAALAGAAGAQPTPPAQPAPAAAEAPATPASPTINEDEMADMLNARQVLQQDVTLTRKVDGKVVETKKETIVYSKDDPVYGTEAALSPLERLKAAFARQALTRKQAYEEAKLDFVVADTNGDKSMTADEFAYLVETWREKDAKTEPASAEEQRSRFVAYLEDDDAGAAKLERTTQAKAKFEFMAGATGGMSRRDYISEVLTDFDALDRDDDGLLRGDELMNFRAANRGEPLGLDQ